MNSYEVNKAMTLGKEAFKSGKKCIPCLDKELMKLISYGTYNSIKLFDAWLLAWHKESLK